MAQASKRLRQLRRLKRDRTLALKMVDHLFQERNAYRQIIVDARQKVIDDAIAASKEQVAAYDAMKQVVPTEAEAAMESEGGVTPEISTLGAEVV